MDDKNNISQPESQTTVNDAAQINRLHDNKPIQPKLQMANNLSSSLSPQSSRDKHKAALNRIRIINILVTLTSLMVIVFMGMPLLLVYKTPGNDVMAFLFAPIILLLSPIGLALAYKLFSERRVFHKEFGKLPHNVTYIVSSIASAICVLPTTLIIAPLIIQIFIQLFRAIF